MNLRKRLYFNVYALCGQKFGQVCRQFTREVE